MPRRVPDILRIEWPADGPPPAHALEAVECAARILRAGGLVAIPTETVYGLAADALDEQAVAAIYRAKDRPAANPLIVHVAGVAMARSLAADWPASAERVAAALWPGPVSIVVPRGPAVPAIVAAGGPTVALRCPGLEVTRLLVARTGRPLAAPSANRSGEVSPTTAHHVLEQLGDRVKLILDAGPCRHGIESTVVDCSVSPPRILRPGPFSRSDLEAVLGERIDDESESPPDGPARSPGTMTRHYAPRTPLELPADPPARVAALLAAGLRVGWLTPRTADPDIRALASGHDRLLVVQAASEPEDYARVLYATLHALDERSLDRIVVDPPPAGEAWRAIHDRLTRACSP